MRVSAVLSVAWARAPKIWISRRGRGGGHHRARRLATLMAAVVTVGGVMSMVVGVSNAWATNSVGPGYGVDVGGHNSGAYSITTTDGQMLGYCITPGLASPTQIPDDVYSPIGAAPNGGLAYLSYFAATFQGGFPGYDTNDVDAAVAYIAYGTGLGSAPLALVNIIEANMSAYPGPWTVTIVPPSGGSYTTGTNYTGDVTVTAANGNGVPGLAITAPATGGTGQWSNFVWLPNVATDVTDAAGHLPFQFSQSAPGGFLEGFSVVGGAPGSTPVEYGPPAGSGGQSMLAAVAGPSPSAVINGTMSSPVTPGSLVITKTDSDTKVGLPGAQFTVYYDAADNGVFSTQIVGPNSDGSFTTGADGKIIDPAGALASLLPGTYRVTETVAPPGHTLPTPAYQDVTIPVGGGAETVTFADQTVPKIATVATGVSQVGIAISDTATLTAASAHATGTITFRAYGPFATASAATCTSVNLAFTSTPVTVDGSGTYQMTSGYTPTAVGLYEWIESYSGDTNNTAVAGSCGDAGETTAVVKVTTTATVQASGDTPIADTVVVQGPLPAGSVITSTLYHASDTTCVTPLWTAPGVVTGTATSYQLDGITEPAGSYQWVETVKLPNGTTVATGSCNAALESSTVLASIPAATQAAVSATPASVTG